MEIKKINEFEYYLSGTKKVLVHDSKSVNIDGETYYKEWADFEEIDFGNDFLNKKGRLKWSVYEYDWLNQFGLPLFKIHYPISFSKCNYFGYYHSENDYVNFGVNIIHEHLLNYLPLINGFYLGRDHSDNSIIKVYLYGYGWNSAVWIELKPHHFLQLELNLINNCNYQYFIRQNQNFKDYPNYKEITEKDKYTIVINILKQKTKKYATN